MALLWWWVDHGRDTAALTCSDTRVSNLKMSSFTWKSFGLTFSEKVRRVLEELVAGIDPSLRP